MSTSDDYPSQPMLSRARAERGAHPAADVAGDARSAETQFLRSFAELGQSAVAELAGISECRLSRWKNAATDGGGLHLPEVAALIAALRLTLVDSRASDVVTLPRAEYNAIVTLARRALTP